METLVERCAGIDVHKARIVATVRIPDGSGGRQSITETFATYSRALLVLRDWLDSHAVTHVAMESTGNYWKPVYYALEDGFTVLLVNAQLVKALPGRKSDVIDSAWIAQLLECGLLRGSFVPPPPIRELRDLTRYRKETIRDRSREVNRLQGVLEDAGLKLSSVASDVMGVSGRAILQALVAGTTDAAVLADLARGKLRAKLSALQEALRGRFGRHHAFLLAQSLSKIAMLEDIIAECSRQIEEQLAPFAPAVANLMTIPGVKQRTAEVLVAETGADMSRFGTAERLCSWSAICPGKRETAGKRLSGRIRHGNPYLRAALVEAAQAAARANRTALQARYLRIKRHAGHNKAIIAVAHQILKIAFYVMAQGVAYHELGHDYYDRQSRERATRRHVRVLERLGYRVTLEAAA